jgi:hypothetical protein
MEESFSEKNRQKREQNAFENLYEFAKETKVPSPKKTAERTARKLHKENGEGKRGP